MDNSNQPAFTIITPSIGRQSLENTIKSLDMQTYTNWRHIIIYDIDKLEWRKHIGLTQPKITDKRIHALSQTAPNNNFGNTPRYEGWEFAGDSDYIIYMDDDDTFCDKDALQILANHIIANIYPIWGVFAGLRLGQVFFNLPPGLGRTMSNQFFHRKYNKEGKPIRWFNAEQDDNGYHNDGKFINSLLEKYPYSVLQSQPLVQVDYISRGNMTPGVYI